MPTKYGDFTLQAYQDTLEGYYHIALIKGAIRGKKNVLVRVHSECLTGDVFGSLRCDCGEQLLRSLEMIGAVDQRPASLYAAGGQGHWPAGKIESV